MIPYYRGLIISYEILALTHHIFATLLHVGSLAYRARRPLLGQIGARSEVDEGGAVDGGYRSGRAGQQDAVHVSSYSSQH